MIQPTSHSSIDTSNIETTETFTIETNESMFRMLTANVYNDTLAAVIREWSTNAVDACIEADVSPNFDVHLPTASELYFSVRDYGTGIPEENLKDFFVLGKSSKRGSNDYNGTLGIGRMAGLAYSDAFSVDSYHNGKRISYTIAFQGGYPTPIHMGTFDTTEPNGFHLKVSVSPNDIHRFEETAEKIYRYFEHKPNLNKTLNITIPESKYASDDWFFDTEYNNSYGNYVLMSNVLYAIPQISGLNTQDFHNLILKCPTGSVSFNPGRESLSIDTATKDYINQRFLEVVTEYEGIVYKHVKAQTTPLEQITSYVTMKDAAPFRIRQNLNLDTILASKYHHVIDTRNGYMHRSLPDTNIKKLDSYSAAPSSIDRNYVDFSRIKNVLILDVKTNFKPIYEQFDKSLLIIQREAGKDMDLFKQSTSNWLDDFGITDYHYASEYQVQQTKGQKRVFEGMYACNGYLDGSFRASQKTNPTETYWYIPITGSRPTMPVEDWQKYLGAWNLLAPDQRKPLVGVQKKYLEQAKEMETFLPAKEAIQEALDNITFTTVDYDFVHLRHKAKNPSPMIAKLYTQTAEYYKRNREKTFLPINSITNVASIFDFNTIPFDTPATYEEIEEQYPVFWHLTNDYQSSPEYLTHYLKLKDHYDSTHPTSEQDTDP